MKNKILSWLVTIGLCVVLVPVGCILMLLNTIWSIANDFARILRR